MEVNTKLVIHTELEHQYVNRTNQSFGFNNKGHLKRLHLYPSLLRIHFTLRFFVFLFTFFGANALNLFYSTGPKPNGVLQLQLQLYQERIFSPMEVIID